jgi:hypothetical protein
MLSGGMRKIHRTGRRPFHHRGTEDTENAGKLISLFRLIACSEACDRFRHLRIPVAAQSLRQYNMVGVEAPVEGVKVEKVDIAREEVIRFYVNYDLRKKSRPLVPDAEFLAWPWDDPEGLDQKLGDRQLKKGVLAAYRSWKLVRFDVANLLECAIVNHIFPGEPQALSELLLRGKLAEWLPLGAPEWWGQLGSGSEFDQDSALVVRPALNTEAPAKWYLEDGSGRALALLQRILRYGEINRTVRAYLGYVCDERSPFIKSQSELNRPIL